MAELQSTDKSLILRLRDGDDQAASEFYDRYVRRVFGLVQNQMAEHLRAYVQPEDIVQSVFKSIFRGITSGDYDAPAGGSLWQLVAIVAVHKVRRNARRRKAEKRDERRNQPLEVDDVAESTSSASPEEFVMAIRESIDGLRPIEQDVAMLRVQGFSVEEISSKLSRSRRSIERSLHTIRQKLIQILDDGDATDD